jgi:hypothetical protein
MANTYVEPTAGSSLNTGRININDSLRAVLTNFKSAGLPGSAQITVDGVASGEQDGMLYRSAVTNALYISDSVYGVGSVLGGKFTRRGIGNRIESSFSLLTGSPTLRNSYEIGELVGVLDTGKLYLKSSNTGADTDFKDVGTTQGYTVDPVSGVASFTGQNTTVLRLFATNNVAIGTVTPVQTLDVRGNVAISGNAFLGSILFHNNDVTTYSGYPASTTGTYVINTAGSERFRVDSTGNIGIGTNAPRAKLEVQGNANIATSVYTSTATAATINVNNPTAQFSLTLTNNQINTIGFNGVAEVGVNYSGYISGTTQFRNFVVYNGKNSPIGTFTGSTGSLTVAGDISAFSDERLKSNIRTIDNALDKVTQLRGVYFDKDGKASVGVIAQEVEKVLPEVVTTAQYKSISYGNMVGILIEAIKELRQEVAILKDCIHKGA